MVHRKSGSEWVQLPGAPMIERSNTLKLKADGKVEYRNLISFVSKEVKERFDGPVLEELHRLGHI